MHLTALPLISLAATVRLEKFYHCLKEKTPKQKIECFFVNGRQFLWEFYAFEKREIIVFELMLQNKPHRTSFFVLVLSFFCFSFTLVSSDR